MNAIRHLRAHDQPGGAGLITASLIVIFLATLFLCRTAPLDTGKTRNMILIPDGWSLDEPIWRTNPFTGRFESCLASSQVPTDSPFSASELKGNRVAQCYE
jgi:hypothetical protein